MSINQSQHSLTSPAALQICQICILILMRLYNKSLQLISKINWAAIISNKKKINFDLMPVMTSTTW